jgi:hypothetical protein
MLKQYRSLTEYEDNGTSHTRFILSDGRSYTKDLSFTTKYVKNDSLRFEWLQQPDEKMKSLGGEFAAPKKYSVWMNTSGIFSNFRGKETQYPKLATALSGATGLSSGLAWRTPRYRSHEISCKPNLGAKPSEVISYDSSTIIIKQTYTTGTTSKLYIDKSSYLLKKYEDSMELPNGTKIHQVAVFNITRAK